MLAGLDGCAGLAAVNGAACAGLFAGGLEELRAAGGLEGGLVLALVPYLPRSAGTLRALDLRCAPRGGWGVLCLIPRLEACQRRRLGARVRVCVRDCVRADGRPGV